MRRRALSRSAEDEAYRKLRAEMLAPDPETGLPPSCEGCLPLRRAGVAVSCTINATELHHLRKRSSSGALAMRANVRRVCHTANMAIEDHPREARLAGLVVREGDDAWDRLSSRAWRKSQHQ